MSWTRGYRSGRGIAIQMHKARVVQLELFSTRQQPSKKQRAMCMHGFSDELCAYVCNRPTLVTDSGDSNEHLCFTYQIQCSKGW